MDLGNAVYTEFNMNEDVAAYMAENIDLFDCELQLVHSHHMMSTQPSGTDLQTLKTEGSQRNCFVSLIVNNAGTYYAAITRKVQTKSEVVVKNLSTSYAFFGEGTKEIAGANTETNKTIEKEFIEYFDLEVERQTVTNDLEYLDRRFEEIKQKKNTVPTVAPNVPELEDFYHWNKSTLAARERALFEESKSVSDTEWYPDPDEIHKAVAKMATCSFILNTDKFDLKQWVAKHMVNMYKKIFGEDSLSFYSSPVGAFSQYRDFAIDFMLTYSQVGDTPGGLNDEYIQSRIAEAMMAELEPYKDANVFMRDYYNTLEQYVIE